MYITNAHAVNSHEKELLKPEKKCFKVFFEWCLGHCLIMQLRWQIVPGNGTGNIEPCCRVSLFVFAGQRVDQLLQTEDELDPAEMQPMCSVWTSIPVRGCASIWMFEHTICRLSSVECQANGVACAFVPSRWYDRAVVERAELRTSR